MHTHACTLFCENPESRVNKVWGRLVSSKFIIQATGRRAQTLAALLHCLHLNRDCAIGTAHGPCQPSGLCCGKTQMSSPKNTSS